MPSDHDLPEPERRLAASRLNGEYTINAALDWIARFHSQFPAPLVTRLIEGVRNLARVCRGRSDFEIQQAITALLDIQNALTLGGTQTAPRTLAPDRTLPAAEAPPRIYEEWELRVPFTPDAYGERAPSRKQGSVFISYARADSTWLNRLLVHLRPLERARKLDVWHDGKIATGENWRSEIAMALSEASVAILLLTANFLASDFIYEHELQPLVKRMRTNGVVIFPVVVGHCLLDEETDLNGLQLFNDPECPLSRMNEVDLDATLVKLARSIVALRS
jgi:hypothetical protein